MKLNHFWVILFVGISSMRYTSTASAPQAFELQRKIALQYGRGKWNNLERLLEDFNCTKIQQEGMKVIRPGDIERFLQSDIFMVSPEARAGTGPWVDGKIKYAEQWNAFKLLANFSGSKAHQTVLFDGVVAIRPTDIDRYIESDLFGDFLEVLDRSEHRLLQRALKTTDTQWVKGFCLCNLLGWLKDRPLSAVLQLPGDSLFEKMEGDLEYQKTIPLLRDMYCALAYQLDAQAEEFLNSLTLQQMTDLKIEMVDDGTGHYNPNGVYIDAEKEIHICANLWVMRYVLLCSRMPYQLSIS